MYSITQIFQIILWNCVHWLNDRSVFYRMLRRIWKVSKYPYELIKLGYSAKFSNVTENRRFRHFAIFDLLDNIYVYFEPTEKKLTFIGAKALENNPNPFLHVKFHFKNSIVAKTPKWALESRTELYITFIASVLN